MKLNVKILDGSGDEKKELVIDVPPNITIDGLIETLQKKRPTLFNSGQEYVADFKIPTNRPIGGSLLDDGSVVVIKPRGWDWDVKILNE